MKKKNVIYGILLLVGILFLRGYAPAEEIAQEEQKQLGEVIVAIYDDEGVIPEILIVEPGTMVTWVNCTAEEAEIIFLDEGVVHAADCSEYFFINREGSYQSLVMCCEYVASLCFQEPGFYDYLVIASKPPYGAGNEYRGAICVH